MYDRLTESDIKKIKEEIEHRKLVVRPQILSEVREARAHGDLSENFEYYAARKAKGENDSRIAYLENMIKTATVIRDSSAEDEVGLNKRVIIRFPGETETEEFKIVTSVRADSLRNLITEDSPLGKALMGHHAGESVHVSVSADVQYDVEIVEIRNTGEEESDTLKAY
ncbi:MAG: transcription elongation factor GreA [Eubacterium sp.]|nr:transcription elongation factor GreA [Eubacterium sp.]